MPAPDSDENINFHIEKIKRSGALGRSPAYVKLLDYLSKITINGDTCSEISVAIDVFDKDENFDVTSDSTVRVYMYNLRQKLNAYYEGAGSQDEFQLSIPKGAYKLVIEQTNASTETKTLPTQQQAFDYKLAGWFTALGAAAAAVILVLVYFFYLPQPEEQVEEALFSEEQIRFWGGIVSDNKPVMIVIGDYYIFGESTGVHDIRLVREFDINSAAELRASVEKSSQESGSEPIYDRYDVGLTYLPRGSAYALSRVQEVMLKTNKRPRITMMSEFGAEDLRSHHIIYIGYVSGMGVLEGYTFSASKYDVGYSYDELIDSESGDRYTSNLIDAEHDRDFVDYGVISSFSTVENNQVVILAGTRDAGLMEMSELALTSDIVKKMKLEPSDNSAFISIFEVYGFNLTNISAQLVGSEYLDMNLIWGR